MSCEILIDGSLTCKWGVALKVEMFANSPHVLAYSIPSSHMLIHLSVYNVYCVCMWCDVCMNYDVCLVDIIVQIGDFGMSRDLEDNNYYITHGGKIPVKWTAPEVIDQSGLN